ncbi:recombinase family protein [Euryhalocaulis caribicus]|uniref:recombinase family protein n=1 Tax=Euryhalocaulis caribicus TaxID=1161401 RepID=UPI0003A879C7|nr:recombinase family protein [Euryhalocaulis caribicus]
MKRFYGYIRVSTQKQGERGVSLQEQKSAIETYARREALDVVEWFEERVTAAKRGRPAFSKMLSKLNNGDAHGFIIHKIDRSTRNLKDWADIGELIEAGRDVRIATDNLDLHTRGGRLTADIQAVVAADFIRNLRDETRKGIMGRLRQGLYPFAAPIGYLDQGPGRLKTFDPERAHLIRAAFELYASGRFSLSQLKAELGQRGLRTRSGRAVSKSQLGRILNNPFYAGQIRVASMSETFAGAHKPLISMTTFNQVKLVLTGRAHSQKQIHDFLFRRLLKCGGCGRTLIGERQKGHVYYRCQDRSCPVTTIREEMADAAFNETFGRIEFSKGEIAEIRSFLPRNDAEWAIQDEVLAKSLKLRMEKCQSRLDRLTNVMLDGVISPDLYAQHQASLTRALINARQKLNGIEAHRGEIQETVEKYLELLESLKVSYESGNRVRKRELITATTSNRLLEGKNLSIELFEPFCGLQKTPDLQKCCLSRDEPRTLARRIYWTVKQEQDEQTAANDNHPEAGSDTQADEAA